MRWLTRLFHKQKAEKRLDAELKFHMERQIADNVAAGLSPEEARRHARLAFGSLEGVKEDCRESRRANFFDTLWQDVRFGLRLLRKSPGFTVVAVLTLALGIGANTAIFSIVNAVLLRPLPLKDSARLIDIHTKTVMFPTFVLGNSWPASQQIRSQASSLEESAVYLQSERSFTGHGDPAILDVAAVSDGFFEELGATAERGRLFTSADYRLGQNVVAVISNLLWRTRFGSDPAILGRTLILDKELYTVIGVAIPRFDFPEKNEIWVPISLTAKTQQEYKFFALSFLGKLRKGRTIKTLNTELAAIAQRIAKDHPELKAGYSMTAQPLLETRVESSRSAFLILLGASTLVLLISCANLASLLLARGSARHREMALRTALGASRGRLLRQGLVESCLVALGGGGFGVLVAAAGMRFFHAIAPSDTPRLDEVSVDSTLLWFSLITSLFAGVLFGLAPAGRAARFDPNDALKEGSGATLGSARSVRQSRLGNTLVVVEVALAFVLLIGSALMTQTLYNLLHQDPGFRTDHLLTFDLPGPPIWDDPGPELLQRQAANLKQILEQVQRIPGVANVTAADIGLLTGMSMMHFGLQVEGAIPAEKSEERPAVMRYVYPSYFRALGIPFLRGREFTEHDVQGSPGVVMVNEAMARAYWGSLDVLGKRVSVSKDKQGKPVWSEVIGVVLGTREESLDSKPKPEYYLSLLQGGPGDLHLLVRTLADPETLATSVSRQVWAAFPNQPITHLTTMSRTISESVGDQRLRSVLLIVFAAIGFVLALLGIYGVLSYSVARRVQEIGIRIALGAQPAEVMQMVLRQGLLLVVVGVVSGAAAALGLVRVIASQLYGVKPADPVTFLAAVALVFVVALLACLIPARRAMRVDPIVALRYE